MTKLEQNPEVYQELKVKMLAAVPEKYAKDFFASEEHKADMMSRFYPGITPEAVEKMREQLHYEQNYLFLKQFAFDIDKQFGSRTISIKKENP